MTSNSIAYRVGQVVGFLACWRRLLRKDPEAAVKLIIIVPVVLMIAALIPDPDWVAEDIRGMEK